MIKKILILSTLVFASSFGVTQAQKSKSKVAATSAVVSDQIEWISFEELEAKLKVKPKMILFDFYTDWCGWCKVMDKKTYASKELAKYVNQHFYAVKFNAESKEKVNFMGNTFEYVKEYKSNRIAAELMGGKMSYPTTVFASADLKMINPVPGYQRIDQMEGILKFFVEAYPKNIDWNTFQKTFKASWTPLPDVK